MNPLSMLIAWWQSCSPDEQAAYAGVAAVAIIDGLKRVWPWFDVSPWETKFLTTGVLIWAGLMVAPPETFALFLVAFIKGILVTGGVWTVKKGVGARVDAVREARRNGG